MLSYASRVENNDLVIENGEFALVADHEQVIQNVRERLLSFREDFFLDRTHGVPYLQEVFTKPLNLNKIELLIKTEILDTQGVKQLLSFTVEFDKVTRKLLILARFQTTFNNLAEVSINV